MRKSTLIRAFATVSMLVAAAEVGAAALLAGDLARSYRATRQSDARLTQINTDLRSLNALLDRTSRTGDCQPAARNPRVAQLAQQIEAGFVALLEQPSEDGRGINARALRQTWQQIRRRQVVQGADCSA